VDSKLEKWLRWLDVIHDDVQQLVVHKQIFWEVGDIVNANEKIQVHSAFYDFIGNSHAAFVAMGVRRHVKVNKDSISFRRLLEEIKDAPHVLSRDYYRSLYKGKVVGDLADNDFDKFSGPGKDHIDRNIIDTDLCEMSRIAKKVEDLTDKRIAHYDKRKIKEPPTFKDLDASVEFLDSLYCKYNFVLRASSLDTLMPTFQYNWKEIFKYRWIENE
jgi:hypothetical protein